MSWKQEAKEAERRGYSGYCSKVKKEGKEPIPYHVWQEENDINRRCYSAYCNKTRAEGKEPLSFIMWQRDNYLKNK